MTATKVIDLSNKGIGLSSVIIIASCIQENSVLTELKYTLRPNQRDK